MLVNGLTTVLQGTLFAAAEHDRCPAIRYKFFTIRKILFKKRQKQGQKQESNERLLLIFCAKESQSTLLLLQQACRLRKCNNYNSRLPNLHRLKLVITRGSMAFPLPLLRRCQTLFSRALPEELLNQL